MYRGTESLDLERPALAALDRLRPEVISVVERHGPPPLQLEHGADVDAHGSDGASPVLLGVGLAEPERFFEGDHMRDVSVQLVVG